MVNINLVASALDLWVTIVSGLSVTDLNPIENMLVLLNKSAEEGTLGGGER